MSLKASKLYFQPFVGLFFLLLLSIPIYSICLFESARCEYIRIGSDSLAIVCSDFSDTIFSDTSISDNTFKSAQLKSMKKQFDTSTFCFLGVVDTVVKFKTPPEGKPCTRFNVDSVHVRIDSLFKGQAPHDYWFIDTLDIESCEPLIFIDGREDPDPGYNSIKGTRFIAFTNDFGSLRNSNIRTSGCSAAIGYFIDNNNDLMKSTWYSTTSWRKISLYEFLKSVSPSRQVYTFKQGVVASNSIEVIQNKNTLKVRSLTKGLLRVAIYSLNGKILFSNIYQSSGHLISVSFNDAFFSSGICIAKISCGEALKTLRVSNYCQRQ